jgi:hypothetical protein
MATAGRAALRAAAFFAVALGGDAPATAQECGKESVTGHVLFFGSASTNFGNRVEHSFSAVRQAEVDEEGNCRVSGEIEERVHRPDGTLLRHSHGTVVCFTVEPNTSGGYTARIAASIDRTEPPLPPTITHGIVTVEDNGEGAHDPPDRGSAINGRTEAGAYAHCATHSSPPMADVVAGNVQIRN